MISTRVTCNDGVTLTLRKNPYIWVNFPTQRLTKLHVESVYHVFMTYILKYMLRIYIWEDSLFIRTGLERFQGSGDQLENLNV